MHNSGIQHRLQRLTNQVQGALRLLADSLVFLNLGYHSKSDAQVCIIRIDALGDFVSWLPIAEILCAHFRERDLKTILVANDSWSQFALDLKLFDKVIAVNRDRYLKDLFYRFNLNRLVRKIKYDCVINAVYRREFYISDSLVRIISSHKKIGFNCSKLDGRHRAISDQWYTTLVAVKNIENQAFMSYRMLDELSVKYQSMNFSSSKLELVLSEQCQPKKKERYYVIAPSASWIGKSWPSENWSELCRWILEKTDISLIIIGTVKDKLIGQNIKNNNNRIYDYTGKTSILDMANIISRAELVITNDSSPVHFAIQLGIPSICILGGGHYGEFLPLPEKINVKTVPIIVNHAMPCYGCNWECPYRKSVFESVKCISDIKVDDVLYALNCNNFLN